MTSGNTVVKSFSELLALFPVRSALSTMKKYFVPGDNPANWTLCDVALEMFTAALVYAPLLAPYFARPCEGSSVVHVIRAEPVVIEVALTPVMTGGTVSASGANTVKWVVSPEVVLLDTFAVEF
jgi:hypothetical protein